MTVLRLVTPLPADRRERLEDLARASVAGQVSEETVQLRLRELTWLPEEDALMWFTDLRAGVAAKNLPWFEVVPDAVGTDLDEQADDAAQTRIDLALDALEGGN